MIRSTSKRALIVRHVPREGLAAYRTPIDDAGYVLERLDVADPEFADADLLSPDLVILMGGPMGVYEKCEHPWITDEIERVAERLDYGLPTLGVCFGAQIIAAALGADIYAGPEQEIGFAPVDLTEAGRNSPLEALASVPVLHWHGDTFDLPRDTELLASTGRYPHQAFRRDKTLLALQFHAEMGTDPRIEEWINESPDTLAACDIDSEGLRRTYSVQGPRAAVAGQSMIANWIEALSDRPNFRVTAADNFSQVAAD